MKTRAMLLALLLAGCGGAGNWAKPGVDVSSTSNEYQECRELAGEVVKSQADIDQDIIATRGSDWGRSGTGRVQTQTTRDMTRDRAGSVIASCMQAKGFQSKK